MPAVPVTHARSHALAATTLIVALVATWFAYAPGLGGSLHFDDPNNLRGLALIHDSSSAFWFVASGIAGPLGRPLSLATFVPQAYAWPHAPEVFLRTNILIHMLNGALVAWLLYLLGLARRQTERQASLIAVGAAAMWMLMPILASSSLFIVQRMTTVSAMFMFLGAIGYLYARQSIDRRPSLALCGMTIAVGLGAGFGALAKENGALLFLFILAIEATLLDRPASVSRKLWRSWFFVVLGTPLVVLLIFLAASVQYSDSVILFRNFNGFERVLTQAGILWKYLYLAFIPNIPSLGPFHDDHQIQRTLFSAVSLTAVAGWTALIAAAVILRCKVPLLTFAVAWFLLGHLLESTTLRLELFYEHRNYVPLVGPVYAIVASLAQVAKEWRRLMATAVIAYTGLLAGVLFSVTSLWGSPLIAAEMWYLHRPNSARAALHLAGAQAELGDLVTARRILAEYIEANPDSHHIRLQVLVLSCAMDRGSDQSEEVLFLKSKLPEAQFSYTTIDALDQLIQLISRDECRGIERSDIYDLGQRLIGNPRYSLRIAQHNIHVLLARVGVQLGDFDRTMKHMEKALGSYHNPDTLAMSIGILVSGGRLDIARELLNETKDFRPPRHPLRALRWTQQLEAIESALQTLERESENGIKLDQPERT